MLDGEDVQGRVAGDEAKAELRLQVGEKIGQILASSGGIEAFAFRLEAHDIALRQARAVDDRAVDKCESAEASVGLIQGVFD